MRLDYGKTFVVGLGFMVIKHDLVCVQRMRAGRSSGLRLGGRRA